MKASAHHAPKETDDEKPEAPSHIQITEQRNSPTSSIVLSGIKSTALLINQDLEIMWQNKGAFDHLWQKIAAADNGNSTPNILNLIFDASFKRQITNFPEFLDFFLDQLLRLLSEGDLRDRIAGLPEERQKILLPLLGQLLERHTKGEVYGGFLKLDLTSGSQIAFEVVALNCHEGRLLIFETHHDDATYIRPPAPKSATDRFERIRRHPNPMKTSYFLLAAEINQASSLRTELLAEDHWRIINSICRRCLLRIEYFGGVFGQHIEHGFFAYFLPNQNLEADAMHVIECALEIKAEALELGRQWKITRNWLRDIDLNIGIHFEEAYVGTLPVSSGDILTGFGEGLRVAGAISQLADSGQIWATKPVFNRIPTGKNKSLRFGILQTDNRHQQRFIRNGFTSVGEVFNLQRSGGSLEDELSYLPITQIFDFSGLDD